MPKKINYDDDEDMEMPPLPPPPARKVGRPKLPVQPQAQLQYQPQQPQQPVPRPVPQLKRYTAFSQPAAEGIMDTETQEVIATDIWTILADIKGSLERIEMSIGSMIG
jgi:hypothetical protein